MTCTALHTFELKQMQQNRYGYGNQYTYGMYGGQPQAPYMGAARVPGAPAGFQQGQPQPPARKVEPESEESEEEEEEEQSMCGVVGC